MTMTMTPTALRIALSLCAMALLAGCANDTRSRDTGNPDVGALTLAMQVCSNCHGVTGRSESPNFPNLAAQQPAYTMAQLNQFRAHSRADPAGFEYMWGVSRHLSDGQIQGLAAYYAGQAAARPPDAASDAQRAAGRVIFESGVAANGVPACALCHGAQGEGNAGFPRLAGQHADYLVKQLVVFQRTDERPEGSVMKTVAHGLSRTDIGDVAAYLQGMNGTR